MSMVIVNCCVHSRIIQIWLKKKFLKRAQAALSKDSFLVQVLIILVDVMLF